MMGLIHGARRVRGALVLGASGLLSAAVLTVAGAPATAAQPASSPELAGCAAQGHSAAKIGRFGGIQHAVATNKNCPAPPGGDPAIGTPPLLFHGGPMMGTRSTGPIVVTPIFWAPAGHPMDSAYKNVVTTYLRDVAAASGTRTNVYSTATEYSGSNGSIRYQVQLGAPVNDSNALPADGCQLVGHDKSGIYADNTGYDSCIDDNQVIAETDRVITAQGMSRDLAHMYVMFLPKHVESCFFPGGTSTARNFCTINYEPSATYCAYHSQSPTGAVYSNMPFPIYLSPVGFTCGTNKNFGAIQSPNGNPDADVEISPTSHEIMESITDPDTVTGWYDSSGFENGDECAYVFGVTQGVAGKFYNQVINNHRYLTQEEFSNADFARSGGGCLQHG